MNKAQLIKEMANKVDISKKEIGNIIDATVKTIADTLSKGEKVTLVGFGSFQVRQRKERKGINPQTRKSMQIPAKKVPKFKAGKELREVVG